MKTSIIFLAFLFSTSLFAQSNYEIVVATDFDGKVVSGSIEELITEIRKGKPVRIGWQLDFNKDKKPDFDHWVSADFITILGGHVFSQIDPIFVQGPNEETPQVEIYPVSHQWTAMIGTNGLLLNRFIFNAPPKIEAVEGATIDEEAAKKKAAEMNEVKTWKVATFWSVMR